MRRILIILAALLAGLDAAASGPMPDSPFGWAVSASFTSGDDYELTGGDSGRTVVLRSNGTDMREDIIKAVKDYDTVVFDGSGGDFIVSQAIRFSGLRGKTLLGVNGARIRTEFTVTPELTALLDAKGVKAMSDQGDGAGDSLVHDDPCSLEGPLLESLCEHERLARGLCQSLHLLSECHIEISP